LKTPSEPGPTFVNNRKVIIFKLSHTHTQKKNQAGNTAKTGLLEYGLQENYICLYISKCHV